MVHDFGRYWWTYGRDKDDDGQLREAVFLEIPLRKDVEARQIRAHLSMRQLKLVVHGDTVLEEDFEDSKWLDVGESYWEIEVKEVKKVRRKVLRYVLYVMTECPKYITQWLFASEKKEDDGRYIDQEEEEADNIDDRLRMIAKMKEPEPHRDADIWFSETEEEEERWCDGCGSTRVVIMKKHTDAKYMKYCNDCPFVSPAKAWILTTRGPESSDSEHDARRRKSEWRPRRRQKSSQIEVRRCPRTTSRRRRPRSIPGKTSMRF
ncbi:unnamed protein product [Effrenium voratum]|nr:unnamed protein product [Effrenium voratum]